MEDLPESIKKSVACWGNHDYLAKEILSKTPWFKRNSGYYFKSKNLVIYCFDDYTINDSNQIIDGIDLKRFDTVLNEYPCAGFILLAHNPNTLLTANEILKGYNVYSDQFLGLAGHTHGVECFLPCSKVNRFFKPILEPLFPWMKQASDPYYLKGYHELKCMNMYINVGIGTHRRRVFCPPELTMININ